MTMIIPTPQTCNVVPGKTTQAKHTLQWLPENTEYPPCAAAYAPLINGEQAFGAVARAIKQAKKSLDIITWGFQPSMYLERPGGQRIGDLLIEAATERNVIVRVLVWFSRTGQMVEANFPGWGAYLPEERNRQDYPFQTQAELIKKNRQRIEKNNVKLMATGDKLGYEDPTQYEFDKYWHYLVANGDIPNITVRRRKIGWIADATTIKARLGELPYPVKDDSSMMRSLALKLGATHHQKMVLVDYEDPEEAVGFMMGHNMLSQYWDTDDHSCLKKKYDAGRDGPTGWQDISGCVYGEVLKHMNDNFVQSWEKDVGDSTPKSERAAIAKEVFTPTAARLVALNERLSLPVALKATMGMVCRTQPQYKKYDILKACMEGVKRARQYIYIENQYFRFQEIAEQIKQTAIELIACGRDPDKHGWLYLFVVTNSTDKPEKNDYPSNEVGGYQTYKMLDALGRADLVPVYAKKEKGATEPIKPQDIPGLKTQICTLVSPNSLAEHWMPVYVHSKMMMVDDTLLVQGSANINLRSMAFDSEIAIALQDTDVSSIIPMMRNELWKIHTGGKGMGNAPSKVFEQWSKIISKNKGNKDDGTWATNFNLDYIFKPNLAWSDITSGDFAVRLTPAGSLFSSSGLCTFPEESLIHMLSAVLNSRLINYLLKIINPTFHANPGDVGSIPLFHKQSNIIKKSISYVAKTCIEITKSDWDRAETSFDFTKQPLLEFNSELISKSFFLLVKNFNLDVNRMIILEEENNKNINELYGLPDYLIDTKVQLREITLTCNPHYRYGGNLTDEERRQRLQSDIIAELISYTIGCMMGRYSLDCEGLVYAHAGNEGFKTLVEEGFYTRFPADSDGILPLTSEAWFEDDIAARVEEFVRTVWGTEHLEENLQFIADSLCLAAIKPVKKGGETSRETIRHYLSTQFFKDHLKTYKKRPIYWLFSSGKDKAFECLVYLHRYNETTLPRIRIEYVTPLLGQMSSRIDRLRLQQNEAETTEAKRISKDIDSLTKQLTELRAFDDQLKHYADMKIQLDLDDGVKVNYGKFGTLLAEVKAVTGDKGE